MSYGMELILDLHNCDPDTFTRNSLDGYFENLCKAIKMVKCERYFWDDVNVPLDERQTSPHTQGTSAVQFILTSNITIHTLDQLKKVFVNIFSCKEFDIKIASNITAAWFDGDIVNKHKINRT